MKILPTIYVFLFLTPLLIAQNNLDDQLEWSDSQLTFSHFKAKPKTTKGIKGEFSTKIFWTIRQYPGEVPEYTVYNKMVPSLSWLSMKHNELLQEYQFLFNISELYTRKIRKEISELNKNKIIDKETYKSTIIKYINTQSKEKKRYEGVLYNQPDLYKILNKQYQDSLKLYQSYALK